MEKINFTKDKINTTLFKTKKFKTLNIKVFFKQKEKVKNLDLLLMLLSNLTYSTKKYNKSLLFKEKLVDLYDLRINTSFNNYEDGYVASLSLNAINEKYLPKNENINKEVFKLLDEIIFNPNVEGEKFDEKNFQIVKKKILNKIEKAKESKLRSLSIEISNLLSCYDENYFVVTNKDKESVKSITSEELYYYYKNVFLKNIEIYVMGDIEEEELKNMIFDSFNFVNDTNVFFDKLYNKKQLPKLDNKQIDSCFTQSAIAIGYQMPFFGDEELFNASLLFLEVLNYVLFNKIREEKNYCYLIEANKIRESSLLLIYSYMSINNVDDTKIEVNKIINDLSYNVEEDVFNMAKNNILNSLLLAKDNPNQYMLLYYKQNLVSKKELDIDNLIKDVKKITKKDIFKIASLTSEKFMVVLKENTK